MENDLVIKDFDLKDDWKLSNYDELLNDYPTMNDFIKWFDKKLVILKKTVEYKPFYKINIFTHDYQYSLYVYDESISTYYHCRYQKPMEDYVRGADLTEGYLVDKTINKIIWDILRNELVYVGTPKMKEIDKNNDCVKDGK